VYSRWQESSALKNSQAVFPFAGRQTPLPLPNYLARFRRGERKNVRLQDVWTHTADRTKAWLALPLRLAYLFNA
jgi:hypothetical protein